MLAMEIVRKSRYDYVYSMYLPWSLRILTLYR